MPRFDAELRLVATETSGVDDREAFGFGAHQLDFFVERAFQFAREFGGAVFVVAIVDMFEKLVDSALKWHGPTRFFNGA